MIAKTSLRYVSWIVIVLVASVLSAEARHARSGSVVVMTRNLYVGADILRIVEVESPTDIPLVVAEILETVRRSQPAERMAAIAGEIAKRKPHLVGLQEVFQIKTQFPGDFFIGNPHPAEHVEVDYLDLLLGALEARGLHYRVVASLANIDVELPGFAGLGEMQEPLFMDVRVVDHDVILARADVETANEVSHHYALNAPLPLPGVALESLRGFNSVDAWVRGRKYRFVNTHLEVDFEGPALVFQALQAQELVEILAAETVPVIVVGDFNSGPEQPATEGIVGPYRQLLDAGYIDAWSERRGRRRPGFTCCHDELLDNPEPVLDRRIDLVLVRATSRHPRIPAIRGIRAVVVGDKVRDQTPSGLWPSDHAGVIARMRLRSAR